MTEDRLRALEERVAKLEARDAIVALKHRYLRACDAKDPEGFRAAFIAKGAVIDYGPLGRFEDADGIAAVYRTIALEKVDEAYVVLDMHHGLHPDIRLTGPDSATGQWTLRFRQVDRRAGTESVSAIEYDDEYAVEDGEWKMSACRSRILWTITRPLSDAAVTDVH
ncbi:nuclear transport factor 2 family protein [Tomitella fengzijianii]|uniref:Nuclear transport factor 2 family protein n=1 Tax=Tomitella fengzijianii TaxID=2597660 RepID=A0A516WZM7_9ACTN|nr:nuclear transport factor 2 family protein [Tomitella fengzijianii]QDQ96255.1 nuclear transport factor 2 family protein [Tomitella fengzijianii]